jgi:putative sigma-54 modulation protein
VKLRIAARSIPLNPLIRELVDRRIHFALGRFAQRISEVVVHFEDVNGPRGGVDQRCRIEASVLPWGRMTAHATEPDAAAALSHASARIARRIKGEFDRRHAGKKRRQAGRAERIGV